MARVVVIAAMMLGLVASVNAAASVAELPMARTAGQHCPAVNPHTDLVAENAPVDKSVGMDPGNVTWTNGVPCPQGISRLAAVVASNKLHIVTGEVSGGGRARQLMFDFATNTWSTGLRHPVGGVSNSDAAAVSDELICVGGGYDSSAQYYNYMTELDLVANTWTQAAAMPLLSWNYFAMAAAGGQAYVFGGATAGTTVVNAAYRYNPVSNTFTALPNMPIALRSQAAAVAGDTIYLIGGSTVAGQPYNGTTNFLKYSISGNNWTIGAAMPFGVMWGRAAAYEDPAEGWLIYVFGGYNSTGAVTGATWVYSVASGTWTQCNSLLAARRSHGGAIYGNTLYAVCGYTGSAFLQSVERGTIELGTTNDVGVQAVVLPAAIVQPGVPVRPTAQVKNFGTNAQIDIPVTCWIDSVGTRVYAQTVTHPGPLAPGSTVNVEFSPDWTPGPAGNNYAVTMFTSLAGDENRRNDTVRAATLVSAAVFSETIVVTRIPALDAPVIDGMIAPGEWSRSRVYDISDIAGRSGTPKPPNSSIAYFLYDDAFMYYAMDCPGITVRMNYDQFGPYVDEDHSRTWASDSSEGNYWMEYVGGDSALYRAILDTVPSIWRMGPGLDAVSAISVASGRLQMEAKVPFGDRKSDYSVRPGDTVGYFQYTAAAGSNYLGWWPQSLMMTNWANPRYYGTMIFNPEVAVAEGYELSRPPQLFRISNPVRAKASIRYYLARCARVSLHVYDATGKLVRSLDAGVQGAGFRDLVWDRTSNSRQRLAAGTYFVQLIVDGIAVGSKTVLLD